MKFKVTREHRSIQEGLSEAEGNDGSRDITVLMGAIQILALIGVFVALNLTLLHGTAQMVFGMGLLFVWVIRIAASISTRCKRQLARLSIAVATCTAGLFIFFATSPGDALHTVGGAGGYWFCALFFFFIALFYEGKDRGEGPNVQRLTWYKEKNSKPESENT